MLKGRVKGRVKGKDPENERGRAEKKKECVLVLLTPRIAVIEVSLVVG